MAAIGALIGWCALVLQFFLSIGIAQAAGRSAAWGIFQYFGFYTVLTNLLVALALTASATRWTSPPWRFFRRAGVQTAIAASIVIVGLTYFLVLRHVWSPQGLLWLADVLLHYVMPVVFVAHWWLRVPARALRFADVPRWWGYPLGYLVYVMVRGAVAGVYPYPFIDLATLGPARTAVNALGILVAFTAVALLLVALGRVKPAAEEKV